ncbi:MAG: hypothetical protein ACI9W6_002326 [Motiliproteus sp.]|jgi:hypothetical protein
MYDNFMDDMKTRMQPVLDLAESSKKSMETLACVQQESMADVVNASLEQFKAVAECKDPKAALGMQINFFKALEAKMNITAEKSIAAISDAKDAYVASVETATQKLMAELEGAAKMATGNNKA